MKVPERKIEAAVVNHAMATGWWAAKFTSPSCSGVPDRLFIRNGKTVYIEFKATGEKPRRLQELTIKRMRDHGATVYVIDNVQDGKAALDAE